MNIEDLISSVNNIVAKYDSEIESDVDLFDHYKNLYHDKYLYEPNDNCLAQVFVIKTHDNTTMISYIQNDKTFKMSPHLFQIWMREQDYVIKPDDTV